MKVSRADLRGVKSLTGWLTTVSARECLDVLRARKRRGEVALTDVPASRGGDVHGLLAILVPDVIRRAEAAALPAGAPTEIRGVEAVVEETVVFGR